MKQDNPTKVRSLADLVQSSVNLSTEVSGTLQNERGNVISHRPKTSSAKQQQQGQQEIDNNDKRLAAREDNKSIPAVTLLMSKDGIPYLKETTAAIKIATNDDNNNNSLATTYAIMSNDEANNKSSTPPETIVNDDKTIMAVGVMDDSGKQVRFCEYDTTNDANIINGSDNQGGSGRDRIERRIDLVEEIDEEEIISEEAVGAYDDDDNTSCGSDTQDDEILKELGLFELLSNEEEDYDAIDMGEEEVELDMPKYENLEQEKRSFRIFWELLTRWATRATIDLVLSYQGKQQLGDEILVTAKQSVVLVEEEIKSSVDITRNDVDIGASRQAGIMSMIKMCIKRCLSDLNKIHQHQQQIDQRMVEQRLADLVRTFDPSAGVVNMNMKQWRGMTTILIAVVFPSVNSFALAPEGVDMLPPSVRTLEMSVEEYRYLTQSAFTSLG